MEVDNCETYSNSSSDSPEPDSDDEEVNEMIISEMKEAIASNPYGYDAHVNLITLLRKAGDLTRLREAREQMSKIFPLTPELWMDWLVDEEKIAVTEEEKKSVLQLFDRAVQDYASVNIWLEYVQFVIGQMGSEDGMDLIRKTFDRALTAVGIHVLQGSLIWDAFREFENAVLQSLEMSDDSEKDKKIENQKNRLFGIFRRQLSVPLMFMDKTYKEYQELTNIDSYTAQQYDKAQQMLEKLKPYEDALYESEPPRLEEYKKYIEFEKKEKNPARIQCIFERALVENCLIPELWLDYTKYMDRVINSEEIVLPIHERAIRNCPWSAKCWNNYLLALERHQKPHDVIKGVFERALLALTSGDDFTLIWTAYLDYLRRRVKLEEDHTTQLQELNATFEKAIEHMTYYPDSDPNRSILQYWAKIKAKYCKDVSGGREIWSSVMNQGNYGKAFMWMDYANFEKLYGDDKHYRKVLLKGLQTVNECQSTLGDALLKFEREEGTLESLDSSTEKYEKAAQRANQILEEKKRKAEREEERLASLAKDKDAKRKAFKKEKNKKDVQMDSEGFKIPNVPSRSSQPSELKNVYFENERNKQYSSNENEKMEISAETGEGVQRIKRPLQEDEDEQTTTKRQKVEEKSEQHGVSIKHDSSKDEQSVFLSNLSYDVTEDQIKEAFTPVGEVQEVRLVKDYKGRSKGYCYVVFSSKAEAIKALEKDREFIGGRPMFVSRCEDKKAKASSQKQFKFSTGMEMNKLFIRGLPFSTKEEDLEKIFKEFGAIKGIRLVTYRNGHSKGLAYVEFENESSAAAAVVKTDGLVIENMKISVAISNPPQRKTQYNQRQPEVQISTLLGGGGSSDSRPRGRGRTQLTLVPRALQRPVSIPKKAVQNGNSTETSGDNTKKMNNEDFRNMLLKK